MKSVGVIVPHTHWDREWRYPLWKTRAMLVDFMDGLLDVLETDPEYRCFVLDGQCVPVEDYLEIRPQNRDRICALVQGGRLSIGPWYTLPDLYPVDGECLVRNLLKGIRTSAEFGGHLGVAFTSFGWGQTAQFPQLYKGFDIDFAIVAKRVSPRRAPKSEFLWEAPDGTSVLATRLGEFGRANFFFRAYLAVAQGAEYLSDEYAFDPQQRGPALHRADVEKSDDEWQRLRSREGFDAASLREGFEEAWNEAGETLVSEYRLLMSGTDFTGAQPQLPRMVREANALFDDREFVMGTLEEYAKGFAERVDTDELVTVRGELRDGAAYKTSGNALATRISIKQRNKEAETGLLRRAEPLAAVLAGGGDPYPAEFLRIAWRNLLQAHAHDSINGVTQDKTADDVVNRLQQVLELAGTVEERCVGRLASRVDGKRYGKDSSLLLVVNPLPRSVRQIVDVSVDTPRASSTWELEAFGPDGEPLDVQTLSRRERTVPVHDPNARAWPFAVDRHAVLVDAGEVPPGGYKVIEFRRGSEWDRATEFWLETRRSRGDEIGRRPDLLENEFLRVEIAENGTFTLTDKTSGRAASGLNVFEDTGDAGDYWVYYPPYENRTYTSLGSHARIWMEENGPLIATACTEIVMEVPGHAEIPERGVAGRSRRSEATARLTITSRITLRRGERRIELHTTVLNHARDHRLRVLFPTGIEADHADAGGHFAVDRRRVIPELEEGEEYYPDMRTLPQQSFVDVTDGTIGMAVLNRGLTEYEVLRDGAGSVALTLFRSVRNRICTEFRCASEYPLQDGGQLQGRLDFDYALYPHEGSWEEGGVWAEAERFNVPVSTWQFAPSQEGDMPVSGTLYSLSPDCLVLSALKKAEDRETIVARFFNPTAGTVEGRLEVGFPLVGAHLVNLNERRLSDLPIADGNAVTVEAGPCKIVTVELEPQK